MRIILLGAPGSGKGTQARRLVDNYKVPQISTGDLLRAAVEEGSETGRTAERLMKEGALVPDSLVIELVSQRMLKPDTRRGFILDGFPRNIPQAQELDTRLGWVSRPIQMVINFEVEETVLVQRLTGRRNCKKCGAIYNIFFDPPRVRDRCDTCGAALSVRDDDNEETVRSRLVVYHQQTELLVQYYRAQHKLRTLNANGDPQAIFNRLREMIDTEIRPLENKVISVHGGEGHATFTQIVGGKIVRAVTGSEVRMTRVQPRMPQENGEAGEADAGASKGTSVNDSRKSAARKKTAAGAVKGTSAARKRKSEAAAAVDAPVKTDAAGKAKVEKATTAKKNAATAEKKTAKRGATKSPSAGTSRKVTRKKTAKKVAAKSTAAKKTPRKTARQTATQTAKKTDTRAADSTRSTSRKVASKKRVSKTTRKKAATRAAKRSAVKKSAARKKTVTKKVLTKKTAARKVATKKVAARKVAARKGAARKVAAKKGAKKKVAAKKSTTRKSPGRRTAKKAATRKPANRAVKKTVTKKRVSKKAGTARTAPRNRSR